MDQDERVELVVDQEKDVEVEGRQADTQAEIYNIDLDHSSKVVVASTPIPAAKPKVLKIAAALAVSTRKRKGVVIRDPEEELHDDTPVETPSVKDKGKGILIEDPMPMKKKDQIEMDAEYSKKHQEELEKEHEEAYKQIDWNAAFDHVQAKESQYIKRYHRFKKKPQSESEARKNIVSYLTNTKGFKMEFFNGKTYDQILLIFQASFDVNMKFLFKSREEMEKEDEEIIKSINETPAQKAAKRRKLSEEAQEADNLRGRLEIVQDEDDDVFVEAISLAQKVPVVDYQVVVIDNKPRYKIIRADDTHQFYISFTTLLKNFDREDLETLWRIVKDRFSTKKPTNFLDEYLLLTLKTMFGELDEQDAIWRNQKSVHGLALVKRWKLLNSFTLEQLVNVARLQKCTFHVSSSFGIQLWSSARVTSLGVICLPNDEIFAGLARIGYEKPSTKLTFYKAFFSTQWKFFIHTILHSLSAKRTSWNEFSSAMASALICLSSGQRFNFSKYIFKSLVRNVDCTSKFYMYPRVGKGFLGVETPLFENMLADRAVDAEEEVHVPAQDDVVQEHVIEEISTEVVPPTPTLPSPSSPVLDKCSALILRVEGLETANAAQQLEIITLKARVKKLERLNKVKSSKLRRLKKVGTSQRVESSGDVENVFNQGRISVDMDQDERVELEDTEAQEAIEVVTTAKLITEVVTAAATQVVAASTPIPAAKPAAKPKVLKIAAGPAVSIRKRKGVVIRDPEEELHDDTPAETP
nr:hypothetical protein [Tanacetum cinerariifolium]